MDEEPWGHEGERADRDYEYTQDEYAEYEREYPILPLDDKETL